MEKKKKKQNDFISIEIHELPASPLLLAGLRQASTAVNESNTFLNVKIPYLSQSDPQLSVQIVGLQLITYYSP